MAERESDGLVIFGATGDLAFKKVFPALHAMARRGRVPVKYSKLPAGVGSSQGSRSGD